MELECRSNVEEEEDFCCHDNRLSIGRCYQKKERHRNYNRLSVSRCCEVYLQQDLEYWMLTKHLQEL
jgi:hypothetical protein